MVGILGENGKLAVGPSVIWVRRGQTHRDEGKEARVYGGMNGWTPRCLLNCHRHPLEESVWSGPASSLFPNAAVETNSRKSGDEVLNCRKAIWGWAASASPE